MEVISVGSIAGSGLLGLIGLFVGIEWWCHKKGSHDLWTKFKGAALGIGVAHLLLAFTVFREYWSFMPWLTGIVRAGVSTAYWTCRIDRPPDGSAPLEHRTSEVVEVDCERTDPGCAPGRMGVRVAVV